MSLRVDGLVKRFERSTVLDGVTFEVPPASLTCLLGPSGVGKSTVLAVIAGLLTPDAGRVSLGDRVLDGRPPHRRPVTLLMQQPQLFPHLSVLDNVAFGLTVRHVRRAVRQRRARELLSLVGVPELAERSPRQLSGGEQQRVALARALAVDPQLLLADEPFASVDTAVRRQLQDLVVDLHRQLGTTIVLVTHDVGEALALGDQLVVLEAGRVQDRGSPRSLYERPTSGRTAKLLGFTNELTGVVESGTLLVGHIRLAIAAANAAGPLQGRRAATWVIRPERVRLAGAHGPNAVTGIVSAVRFHGPVIEVHVQAGSSTVVAHLPPGAEVMRGETISLSLPCEHLIEVIR